MPNSIHFKCVRDEAGKPFGVSFDSEIRMFWSGNWVLSPDVAGSLIGGWLYLHTKKSEPSYYGGPIIDFVEVFFPKKSQAKRIRFRFRPSLEAKDINWRGRNDVNAWTGNPVESDFAHEIMS